MSAVAESVRDLPDGWEWKRLADVVDILDRRRVPINAKERATRQGDVPYFGATGQVGWIDDYIFDEELVLLGEDGAPFHDSSRQKAYLIRGRSWVNNHAHVLRGKDGIQNAYIKYYLDRFDYHGYVTGTTRLKLNQGRMKEIPIPIAPKEQRDRIVAEIEKQFSRLDEAVASFKRVKANLKRYKAAVLKAAVEGKLTEEWREQNPDVEPASKLLERILAERHTNWEETELAKMEAKGKEPKNDNWKEKYKEPENRSDCLVDRPSNWAAASIDQLAAVIQYGSSSKTSDVIGGVPVLRMGNIYEGRLDLSRLKYLPLEHAEFPALLLQQDDFLFNRTNSPELVGKTAVYRGSPSPCSFASYLIRAQFIAGVSPVFVSLYVESLYGRAWVKSVVNQQVGQANVNGTKLKALVIPLPPDSEQLEIVTRVELLLGNADRVFREIVAASKRINRLRQATLIEAFSGKSKPGHADAC